MNSAELRIEEVGARNREIFDRLIQCYECEFSALTEKLPGADGLFALDTPLDGSHMGFLAFLGNVPVGFNVVHRKGGDSFEVSEFFIVPVFREKHFGYLLAAGIFKQYPGHWEIKQIAGAEQATAFWRKTIHRFTAGAYVEDVCEDRYWGTVTRQRFTTG